ncbi:MAG TPA: bifunctional tetrahydrofolate synthase/dihydrofolate synthase [Oleiagrimonas sp.]|nr:bifunctional tetrahydrofolate synthase/dihydrofolate synthase [Oleiagrimonas sp.]
MPTTLAEWLEYQQHTHKRDIDMGLDRIRTVWQRMGSPRAPLAITVGGTNGKGSTVAFLTAMLRAMGLHVGSYVSPHISVYNERICVDEKQADDATLCASFARIEKARDEIPLTYFEFATLAALDIFDASGVDVMVLEVGLGGRLDATNIVDADVAVITTIDLDHMQWLGPDRDSIGREKAGIARHGRPAIVGEIDPPQGLLRALESTGAQVEQAGRDFHVENHADETVWRHRDGTRIRLPTLPLTAPCQQANAAAALAALYAAREHLPWSVQALSDGLLHTHLRGRLQNLGHAPERVVDVAHNPQAARVLATWLDEHPVAGKVHAVYGAMSDKDVAGVLTALGSRVAHWHLGGLEAATPRGLPVDELAVRFAQALPEASFDTHADVAAAWREANQQAGAEDAVVAFGSFFVVSAVLATDS